MIKYLKSNKIISLLLIIICIIFMLNPIVYSKSCLNALSVWGLKVFPVLFPFFVFTRLIVNLSEIKSNPLDKFFCKVYKAPQGSLFIFFLSVLSGYPMGAKLISTMYEKGAISHNDAVKMMSFCSISGPMFMIGTVGVAIFNSYKTGVIILIVNILACLINGLIFRNSSHDCNVAYIAKENKKMTLGDCVYDSLNSILMVGAYIVLSFLIIDLLKNLPLLQSFTNTICGVFPINGLKDIVNAVISGILEITRGAIDLNATNLSLKIKTIITSASIGFGGISVMLQSKTFLSKLNISTKTFIKQKLMQCLLCLLISIPLCNLFL